MSELTLKPNLKWFKGENKWKEDNHSVQRENQTYGVVKITKRKNSEG